MQLEVQVINLEIIQICFDEDNDLQSDYDSSSLDFMDLRENMIPVNQDIMITGSKRSMIPSKKRILVIDDEPFNVIGL